MTDSPNSRRRNPITLHVGGCDVSELWAKSKSGTPAPPTDVPGPRAPRRTYSGAERFIVIAPVLEFRRCVRERGQRPHWLPLPDGSVLRSRQRAPLGSMDVVAGFIAARVGISKGTIWRWVCRWIASGVAGLRDKARADRGRSRWFAGHHAAADAVRRAVAERRSISAIHRGLVLLGEAPSYTCVLDFVRREVLP